MTTKTRLRRILAVLSPEKSAELRKLDRNIQKIKKRLAVTAQINTLSKEVAGLPQLARQLTETQKLYSRLDQTYTKEVGQLADGLAALSESIDSTRTLSTTQVAELGTRVTNLSLFTDSVEKGLAALEETVLNIRSGLVDEETLRTSLEALDLKVKRALSNIGGGNANRDIRIGGTTVLTKYGDINLKAGSNVTISYSNNESTKYLDVTIAATGGSGTTRSINTIAVDTAAGSTAGTDYVYVCSGTITVTLPTAVGNENLYTVKNAGNGIITVATTSAQTIDGDATVVMPVQYTSVDLISDGSNWHIT